MHTGQLYRRPMAVHILTAQQQCTSQKWEADEVALADHLSRVSLTNKVNFARLHGLSLEVVVNPVGQLLSLFMRQQCAEVCVYLPNILCSCHRVGMQGSRVDGQSQCCQSVDKCTVYWTSHAGGQQGGSHPGDPGAAGTHPRASEVAAVDGHRKHGALCSVASVQLRRPYTKSKEAELICGVTVQVAKPVFSFPLQDYTARGHDLVLRGKLDRIIKGDAWGA